MNSQVSHRRLFHTNCLRSPLRSFGMGLLFIAAGNVFADAGAAQGGASHPSVDPAQLVDDLHSAFGKHRARAVHAKGIVLEGTFTPDAAATQLSQSPLFAARKVPIEVRFSAFTGIPTIPDTADGANPRGMAVKFHLDGQGDIDVVAHSFNGFPVATSAEFGELLRAVGRSGPDASKPTALDRFLATHPIAKTFLTTQKPSPRSYGTLNYFGVNSFRFTNAKGQEHFVRYRLVPAAGEQLLSPAQLKESGADYLSDEIAQRVGKAPIEFEWFAQIGESGDAVADPSIAWPEQRRLVKLGTLRIERMSGDQAAADKRLVFLPGQRSAGIDNADPMLDIRNVAYPVSFGERQ